MENQVQLFESEEFGRIRVVEIDGQPWFILKDICYVLNLSNPTMIAERLDDDEKEILKPKPDLVLDIPNRGLIIVNESGLYAVIIRSDKPEAKKFRRWITNEILPSIRQHGAYITDAVLDEMTRSREFADNLLHRLQSERIKPPPCASTLTSLCQRRGITIQSSGVKTPFRSALSPKTTACRPSLSTGSCTA